MRDYERWHERYDEPGSDLSWRALPAVGAVRYDGPDVPLAPGRLFTFRR